LRQVALMLGLLGMMLQTGLSAWHPFAAFGMPTAEQQFLAELQASICHGGAPADAQAQVPGDRGSDPRANCLICKGLGLSSVAVLATVDGFAVVAAATTFDALPPSEILTGTAIYAPRSRGPPPLA
jgi:hypothetical protein